MDGILACRDKLSHEENYIVTVRAGKKVLDVYYKRELFPEESSETNIGYC